MVIRLIRGADVLPISEGGSNDPRTTRPRSSASGHWTA